MKSTTLLFSVFASIYTTFSFSQAGALDSSFNTDGTINKPAGAANAIAVQPDGKIIAAGYSAAGFTLVRYNKAGNIDKSFGVNGIAVAFSGGANINSIVVKPSGKIIAAGADNNNFAIAKFNADGTLDCSFGNAGEVSTNFLGANDAAYSVCLAPDNKIIAAGTVFDCCGSDESRFALARYNPDGSLDSSFNYDGKVAKHVSAARFDYAGYAILQTDGKIIEIGYTYPTAHQADFTLVRLTTEGDIDSSFGTNGYTFTDLNNGYNIPVAAVVQSDDKIVVVGYTFLETVYKVVLARYYKNGQLDSTFGTNGSVITDFNTDFAIARGITLQPDDKILIAVTLGGTDQFAVARFKENGAIDNSFGNGGYSAINLGSAYAVALQANGKIVAAGTANGNFAVARFLNDAQDESVIADNTSLLSADNLTSKIKLFPNPVKDVLHITGIKSQATISILNAAGKLVKQSTANQTSEINIKQLPSGIYYLHVEENVSAGKDKKISNVKFMKE